MIQSLNILFAPASRKIGARALINVVLLAVCLFAICLALPYAQAELYKWVDKSGRIHYSEIPPQSLGFQVITPQPSSGKAHQPVAPKRPQPESFAQKDEKLNKSDKEVQTTANNEQIRKKNCAAATHNLKTLQSSGRIKLLDGDEYRFLSPEEKEAKITQAKLQLEQYCD